MLKHCKTHGEVDHVETSNGHGGIIAVCRKCRSAKVAKHRRKRKIKAVEYLGGKCIECGYDKCPGALHFHHTDDDKEFGISSRGRTMSWERMRRELDKCVLLCANCHHEHHYYEDLEAHVVP